MNPMSSDQRLAELHAELGLKRPNPTWAKAEIVLGLAAVSLGLLIGVHSVARNAADVYWPLAAASTILQTLGGYLALAGHRSHLYQSQNKLFAWLAGKLAGRNS